MADKFIINRHGDDIVFLRDNAGSLVESARIDSTGMTVQGGLVVQGTVTTINTEVQLTDQLVIVNAGTGPALDVNQTGLQPVVLFKDDGVQVFHIADGGIITLGASGGIQSHTINGALQFGSGSNTPIPTYGFRRSLFGSLEFFTNSTSVGSINSSGNWTVGNFTSGGSHLVWVADGNSANFQGKYSASSTNNPILKVSRDGGAVQAAIGYDDANTRMFLGTPTNHALDFRTNNTKAGEISALGSWTFGSANYSGTHIVNGSLSILNQTGETLVLSKSNSAPSIKFEGGVGNDYSIDINSGTLRFYNDSATVTATLSQAGAWTFGPTSPIVNGFHLFQGGGIAITMANGDRGIGGNCFFDSIRNWNRTSTTTNGGAITFNPNVSTTGSALSFYANKAGDGLSAPALQVGAISGVGAWILGSTTSSTISHTIHGALNIDRAASTRSELNLYKNGSSRFTLAAVQGSGDVIPGTSNDDIAIRSENTHIHFSANGGAANHGSLLNTGVWTFGASGFSGTHTVNGRINPTTGFGLQTNAAASSTTSFVVVNNAAYRVTIYSTDSSVTARIGSYVFVGLNKAAAVNPQVLTLGTIGSPQWTFSYALSGGSDTLVTVNSGSDNQGTRVIVEKLAAS